jgi:hypothetical protein
VSKKKKQHQQGKQQPITIVKHADKSVAASTTGGNDPTTHTGRPSNVYYVVKGYWR